MNASDAQLDSPAAGGIGAVLRAARAARRASLVDLRARTKIDVRYLEALEEERFEDLPPLPFARGFLRTYALELGLDPEPLVERLVTAMSARGDVPGEDWRHLETAIVPARPPSPLRRAAVSAGAAILIAGVALAVFFAQQLREFDRPVPAATPAATGAAPGPAAPAASPPAAPAGSPPAVPAAPAPAAPAAGPAPVATEGVTVDVEAVGRSWILVLDDEGPLFVGFITAGESRRWQSAGPLTIRVGNAAAVILTVNGKTVGPLGRPGEVVSRTFRRDAIP